ncbi:DUF1761 domain-containing protein [Psychrobacillus sp. FJAT-21963]|uniref:DUF1761 domain-containing protein n=1 Tax=Psychrobacillus sp. FJAT-21963 TaxID=1712028 RepID=UPI0006F28CB5|nr:DUF1761 domain-containing protein [Psychrobacillus sp. FJAT-21963]KQL36919.1 hypothetical protein AN959_02380 [Psychrobacillus sp. FJAT-21963]
MSIDWSNLNYVAIIIGGLLYMIYGTIYYSILLGNKKEQQTEGPLKYIYSVIIAFISSILMAILINGTGAETLLQGAIIGFIIGVIIKMVYVKNALFGLISKKSTLIAICDHLVIFTLLGALHGWLA